MYFYAHVVLEQIFVDQLLSLWFLFLFVYF